MRISWNILVVFVLAATLILIHGCAQELGITEPASVTPRFPASPDLLMEEFARAYAAMDLEAYGKLLHEDFVFSFQACDVVKLGSSSDHYTREDELATAAHMFARKLYVKASGQVVAPILEIRFVRFARTSTWVPVDDPDRPGLLQSTYQVDVRFDRGEAGMLVVRGQCVFFVAGSAGEGYRLTGWVDRTGGC